jgi:chaperonin cofactor prefoldin
MSNPNEITQKLKHLFELESEVDKVEAQKKELKKKIKNARSDLKKIVTA